MPKIIPYRDKDGYLMANAKPIYGNGRTRSNLPHYASGGYKLAHLLWCPERESLIWIGHCESCELFAVHKRYEGVICLTKKQTTAGEHYPDIYK